MMISHLNKIYIVYHSVFSFGLASLFVTVDVSNSKMEKFFSESRGERVKRGFVKTQFLLFLSLPHSADHFFLSTYLIKRLIQLTVFISNSDISKYPFMSK